MSAPDLRVAVVGAAGRLGSLACQVLEQATGIRLVARVGREHRLESVLAECGAEVALDATAAGLGAEHARAMLAAGVRPVIGTSGVTREETGELDRRARARDLGGIVVPNFSLGMAWLQHLSEELARHFPEVEIIELHRVEKKDAPSGTARDTAERLARVRGGRAVPIHSLRLPGVYAHQAVLFGAAGETLTLRHDMLGPAAFAPGILAAVRFAAHARGVFHGLDAALRADSPLAPAREPRAL